MHVTDTPVQADHHRGRGRAVRQGPQQRVPLQPSGGGGRQHKGRQEEAANARNVAAEERRETAELAATTR